MTAEGREIRSRQHTDLIERCSFAEAIFLLLQERIPREEERAMLDTLLVASIEHGIEPPSTFVARSVASTGSSVSAALAAGILAFNRHHGGAVEDAALLFSKKCDPIAVVAEYKNKGLRIPGFGHKSYKIEDPRVGALFSKSEALKLSDEAVQYTRTLEKALANDSGKRIPLNIDGACAALLLDLGFDYKLGTAVFILGRMPGLIAHVYEEITQEKPYRRLDTESVSYRDPRS